MLPLELLDAILVNCLYFAVPMSTVVGDTEKLLRDDSVGRKCNVAMIRREKNE